MEIYKTILMSTHNICFYVFYGEINKITNYHQISTLLAHLSRRLIGELIGYSWSSVRPSSSSTMLKDLLRNRLTDQSQILCGASLGWGNELKNPLISLFQYGLVKIRCSQNFLACYKVIALIRKEPRLLYQPP